ncbi:MAG TPA: type II secretion system minor pseudopilin GspK [Woeseiaceae bacterium]|jgi:general secretion pathway protein K|nr:type II secretion system minor pseudopilin GspK [Woeseiaceae bacterium]
MSTARDRRRHRGVALITAMLISALAAMVASDMAWNNALDVRRTTVLLQRDQAVQVALGAESWVIDILRQDLQDTETDHLGEIWAQELPGLPIEGGEIFGAITDLQGRFNVNNLIDDRGQVDPQSLEQFQRLLAVLELDPALAERVVDWLDPNQQPQLANGAEDEIYTSVLPPYRTADRMLTSVSELAAIDGMDKAAFDALAPHITALPGRTPINVNTATPAVLQSLGENITGGDIEALLSEREEAGFPDFQATFSSLVQPEVLGGLTDVTDYFQLRVVVRIGTVRLTLYSMLKRSPGDVSSILRSFGTT